MTDKDQNLEDENQDVFNDDEETQAEETEKVESKTEEETDEDNSEETSEDKKGDKEEAEATPAEAKQDDEANQPEKMIPESRLKAALKSVTDERDAARAELARANAQPAPDRNIDPEGYDLHVRMEASKAIMMDAYPDYAEVIAHYAEMEKVNPVIAQVVAAHPAPAKHAYDLAKKDIEIRELGSLKDSDDWKKFQEWKKTQESTAAQEAAAATQAAIEAEAGQKQEKAKVVPDVPNLNRATDVSAKQPVQDEDDELFEGAL